MNNIKVCCQWEIGVISIFFDKEQKDLKIDEAKNLLCGLYSAIQFFEELDQLAENHDMYEEKGVENDKQD